MLALGLTFVSAIVLFVLLPLLLARIDPNAPTIPQMLGDWHQSRRFWCWLRDAGTAIRAGFKRAFDFVRFDQVGGYVHDVNMCAFIPPHTSHVVTGTWTLTAGNVAGTISYHKAAAAETTTINIPIMIPQNATAGKGSLLKYVEIDHELTAAAATSVTITMNKVTRGVDIAVDVVSAVTGTQLLTPATTAATADQHRDRFTLTTPEFLSDNVYFVLKVVMVCAAGTVVDLGGAFAYYTLRI